MGKEEINRRFKSDEKAICGLWPSGETGAGSIPVRHSGYMLQSAVAPTVKLEASAGVKFSKEVVMKTGIQVQTTKTTIKLAGRLSLRIRFAVAAVAGCLLVVPLTRAYKKNQ
jgi:hypothetical protein